MFHALLGFEQAACLLNRNRRRHGKSPPFCRLFAKSRIQILARRQSHTVTSGELIEQWNRPRPLPSTSLAVHYLLFILPLHAIWSDLLRASLYKTRKYVYRNTGFYTMDGDKEDTLPYNEHTSKPESSEFFLDLQNNTALCVCSLCIQLTTNTY